ncbi:MAG: hypothetical protein P8Z30_14245 [Acidobacteriota bacterium]
MVLRERLAVIFTLVLAAISLAVGSSSARGQEARPEKRTKVQSEPLPALELQPAGTVEFSVAGPGVVESGVQCDANGNVYFNSSPNVQLAVRGAHTGNRPPLRMLSIDSQGTTVFQYPPLLDYTSHNHMGFYVTPRGDVYALVQACPYKDGCKPPRFPVNLVVKYNHDGSVDSVIKIEPPSGSHLYASKFAAFLDGNFLITGIEDVEAEGKGSSKPFTGIFGRGGSYIGPVVLPNDVAPPKRLPKPVLVKSGKPVGTRGPGKAANPARKLKPGSLWAPEISGSLMVGGLDGNIYLLRAGSPARLYAVSSGGEVLGEHLVRPPKPDMWPMQASPTNEGRLFVEFSQAPTGPRNPHIGSAFALIDPQTGKIVETYDAPAKAGIPACMDPQNELLFLRSDKSGRLEIAKYLAQ